MPRKFWWIMTRTSCGSRTFCQSSPGRPCRPFFTPGYVPTPTRVLIGRRDLWRSVTAAPPDHLMTLAEWQSGPVSSPRGRDPTEATGDYRRYEKRPRVAALSLVYGLNC